MKLFHFKVEMNYFHAKEESCLDAGVFSASNEQPSKT